MKAGSKEQIGQKSTSPLPVLPVEWLDARAWRLPSGQPLADYALRSGFLAPLLLAQRRGPDAVVRNVRRSREASRRKELPQQTAMRAERKGA